MLTVCLEMLFHGPHWSTRHSLVCKHTCSISDQWTGACDRRLIRLISHTHHTSGYRQICHVENTAQHCRLGKCQEDSKSTSVRSYVSLEVERSSPSAGCARNKRQYPIVLQSLKSFLWMLDCAWMDCLLSIFAT